MKISGPIEAGLKGLYSKILKVFPLMKISGPIEAEKPNLNSNYAAATFPLMKISGPIEARTNTLFRVRHLYISADENQRPH